MNFKTLTFYSLALALSLSLITCCNDSSEPRKGKTTAVFNPDKEYGTVTDIDGNMYKTITIGTQTWMAENLRVTHYQNSDPIPNVKDALKWEGLKSGAYCSYNNTNDEDSIATYGLLYNGYTCVDERGLCPDGWHIPNDEEWTTLVNYVDNGDNSFDPNGNGTNGVVGGRLKETGTLHWEFPNRFADNRSGFTALPNGWRESNQGTFAHRGYSGDYWSSSEYLFPFLLARGMSTDFASIGRYQFHRSGGLAVRCLKN